MYNVEKEKAKWTKENEIEIERDVVVVYHVNIKENGHEFRPMFMWLRSTHCREFLKLCRPAYWNGLIEQSYVQL